METVLTFEAVGDLKLEFSINQVLLVYLPSVNRSSLIHLALWNGSFDIRDYPKYRSEKLRDKLRLTSATLQTGAAPYGFVRVSKRPAVEKVAEWCSVIAEANRLYLAEMRSRTNTADTTDTNGVRTGTPLSCVPSEWINVFASRAAYYGLTTARANRVCQNLPFLRTFDSYGDMKEDSCVIFYFVMLDNWRQFRLGLRLRDDSGRWRDFEKVIRQVGQNRSEGNSKLSLLAPFRAIDPYRHFVTFELQLNNNHAIGNPSVKANQADTVITDVGNRRLYVIEAKKAAYPDEEQLSRLLDSIDGLTGPSSASPFRGYEAIPILLLDRPDMTPIDYGGRSFPVITWQEVVRVVSEIST